MCMLGLSENEIGIKSKRQLSVINFNPSWEEIFFCLLFHEKRNFELCFVRDSHVCVCAEIYEQNYKTLLAFVIKIWFKTF